MSTGSVIQDSVSHLPGEVQPFPVLLQNLSSPDALFIMGKTVRIQSIQCPFSRMAKRRMSKIMSQRDCFHKIFIQPQRLGYGPGNLGYLEGMRQPRTVMVTLGCQKYLCLILHPAKRLAMKDSVPVSLIDSPYITFFLLPLSASRKPAAGSIGTQHLLFS